MNAGRMLDSAVSSTDPARAARARALHSLLLVALVLIVFGRCATHEFVNFDDDKLIFANPNLVPPTWDGLVNQWRAPDAHLYIPAVYTAWWLLAALGLVSNGTGGYTLNPWVFHSANLLVHLINVLLVRRILLAIIRDDLPATLGAAVFAVHPFQVEAVAWATGMKDLLCGFFSLLSILACIHAAQCTPPDAEEMPASDGRIWGGGKWITWLVAILCYSAALLSKPSAVTLPLIAAMVVWLTGSNRRTRWIIVIAGLFLAIPIVLVTRSAQEAIGVTPTAMWTRPLIATDALAFYVRKLVWPFGLTIDYGRTPATVVASGAIYWTWIIPLVMTLVVLFSRRRMLLVGWGIFVAGVGANLGLLTFQYQVFSTVSDRYIYLSMLGVAIAVAWLGSGLPQTARIRAGISILIAALAVEACVQAGYWRDSKSLWNHAIAVNSRSTMAHINLAASLLAEHQPTAAIPLLDHAAELDPGNSFVWLNLTQACLASGDTQAAARNALLMVQAYRLRPDFNPDLTAAVLEHFALALRHQNDPASAAQLDAEAAALRTGHSVTTQPAR
jgi:hypothetical protein